MNCFTEWGEHFVYKFTVTRDAVVGIPAWRADAPFPPLPPRVAIANSKSFVKQLLQEVGTFEPKFRGCELRVTSEYEGGWWYYYVTWFVPDLEDMTADWGSLCIPVLFDGSIPQPEKFKYADRAKAWALK